MKLINTTLLLMIVMFAGFGSAFPWDDSLDAYWSFDESSGTVLPDRSGNGFVGTLFNMTDSDWVTGILGNALEFDGINDIVNTTFINSYATADNFSMNFWLNTTNADFNSKEIYGVLAGDNSFFGHVYAAGLDFRFSFTDSNGNNTNGQSTTPINTGTYNMITIVRDTSADTISMWVNGALEIGVTDNSVASINFLDKAMFMGGRNNQGTASTHTNGSLDEFAIFGRALNQSEINELFNGGAGIPFGGANVSVTLTVPANASTHTGSINLSANLVSFAGLNLTNATLIVWNSTGFTFNETTISLTGQSNISSFNITGFTFDTYEWNIVACANSSSSTECVYSQNNFTFDWIGFEVIDEIFNNQTTEGNVETFSLEILTQTGFSPIEANLIWNGTVNPGTIISLGGNSYNFTHEMTIPSIDADTNITFFWQLIFNTGSEFQANTTEQTQLVLDLNVDDCSVLSLVILNYSLFEEESQAILNGTIEIDLNLRSSDNSQSVLNFSQEYVNVTTAAVCLNAGSLDVATFIMEITTSYTAPNFAQEFHNIQAGILSSATAPINISLFDLASADSTIFALTYKGLDFLPIPGSLFNIQRRYIADGDFKSVEVVEADAEGGAKAHFDVEGVIYRISITLQGVLIDSFDNVKVLCDNVVTGDCSINLNSFSSNTDFTDWESIGGITYTMVFDENARTITTTFNVLDGTPKLITINTTEFSGTEDLLCTDSLTSSAGTLTCNIPLSFGNGSMISRLIVVDLIVTTRIFTISASVEDTFGVDAYVFAFILIATFPLMMISSTIGVVIGLIFGVLASFMLLLVDNSGLLGPASAFMWLLVAGAILVYKLFRRDP